MARRRRSLIHALADLPWPLCLGMGVAGFLAIRFGVPAWSTSSGNRVGLIFSQSRALEVVSLGWLAICALAALLSFLGARRRRWLLDTRTGLESLASLGWPDFERLVGEAFRREGYAVEESGLGGADGGIDLVLRRDGRRTLVQCKQWRRHKVPVNVVREMYGLLAHHGADAVCIAALGGFTPDAGRFAQGKPIRLIDGAELLGMIQAGRAADATPAAGRIPPATAATAGPEQETTGAPPCPRCGSAMVRRRNRSTGSAFWGCPAWPRCRGTAA